MLTIEAARTHDGLEPVEEFISSLMRRRKTLRIAAEIEVLFEEWAQHGRLEITRQQRQLRGDLWEVKTPDVRLPYYEFQDVHGRVARLTHGFKKDTGKTAEGKTPRKYIDKGFWIMGEDREC